MAKMVTGTRHNVTLDVQCLQFPLNTFIAPITIW